MDAPLGILFLKKVELYREMTDLDKRAENVKKELQVNPHSKLHSTWPLEKNILRWTYDGHKHLGSPIQEKDFCRSFEDNKLKDWNLCENNKHDNNECILLEEYEKIIFSNFPIKIIENLVHKGYADYYDCKKNSILFNKEGLLLGEVIFKEKNSSYMNRSYRVFGWIMDSGGAWILLILTTSTILLTVLRYFWKTLIPIWNYFFSQLWSITSKLISFLINHINT